jgi:hypothetical protein
MKQEQGQPRVEWFEEREAFNHLSLRGDAGNAARDEGCYIVERCSIQELQPSSGKERRCMGRIRTVRLLETLQECHRLIITIEFAEQEKYLQGVEGITGIWFIQSIEAVTP